MAAHLSLDEARAPQFSATAGTPETTAKSVTASVLSRPCRVFRAMPVLVKCGALAAPTFAACWMVLAVMAYAGIPTGTMEASIAVENARLTHRDPIGLSFAILVGLTAYGFWTERFWARYAALGFWVLMVVFGSDGMVDGTVTLRGVLWLVAITLIAWWYFFRKQAVVAYYAALQSVERPVDRATHVVIPPGP